MGLPLVAGSTSIVYAPSSRQCAARKLCSLQQGPRVPGAPQRSRSGGQVESTSCQLYKSCRSEILQKVASSLTSPSTGLMV